ncbi:sulfatase-like hydrolase/transferase [Streptomyces adustus]|uniref:sulfatase-like hydrolase/transferase n=1 Tax=Streptomyces adustus TaxID=1609272 RepID=UPI0035D5C20D
MHGQRHRRPVRTAIGVGPAAYDTPPAPKPKWQDALKPLSDQEKRSIDQQFAERVRSVQAVDDMIGHLRGELKAKGIADNTYIVFSSDKGFHMGEHRLRPGKQTAWPRSCTVSRWTTGARPLVRQPSPRANAPGCTRH